MINQLEYIVNTLCGEEGNENNLIMNLANKYHYIYEINKYLNVENDSKNIVQSILKLQSNLNTKSAARDIFALGVLPSSVSVEVEFEETQYEAEDVEFTYDNLNESIVNGETLENDDREYDVRDAIESYVDEVSWSITNQAEPEPNWYKYESNRLMSPDDDKFVLALNEYIATGRTDEDHYIPNSINYPDIRDWVAHSMNIIDENSPKWEIKLNNMLNDLKVVETKTQEDV